MAMKLVNPKNLLWISFLRVISSLLVGGLFYLIWLATFLFASPKNTVIEVFLWLIAPIITGIGFTAGVNILNRLVNANDGQFLHILIWPLTGCILGALIVYSFGPMLIVFSMLALGTLSILIRELLRIIIVAKDGRNV